MIFVHTFWQNSPVRNNIRHKTDIFGKRNKRNSYGIEKVISLASKWYIMNLPKLIVNDKNSQHGKHVNLFLIMVKEGRRGVLSSSIKLDC